MKLLNWLLRKKPIHLEVVRVEEHKLRLSNWQMDRRLCHTASKVLDSPDFKLMLSVLKNESPANTALPYGVGFDDRVVLQARTEGYQMCLANLEALAICTEIDVLPESVFEP